MYICMYICIYLYIYIDRYIIQMYLYSDGQIVAACFSFLNFSCARGMLCHKFVRTCGHLQCACSERKIKKRAQLFVFQIP